MKLSKGTTFAVAVGLQLVIILSIVLFKMTVLVGGTDVILKIRPIDPRDWLRGDYAVFQYDISEVPLYMFRGKKPMKGEQVYVSLRQGKKYWYVSGVHEERPSRVDRVFIKGRQKKS